MEKKYKDLIIKFLSDNLSPSEETELQSWINNNSNNKNIFAETKGIWNYALEKSHEYSPDTQKKWLELKQKLEVSIETKKEASAPTFTLSFHWYMAAAAFLLIVGLSYILTTAYQTDELSRKTASNLDVFYLPDSSIVYLNKNSILSYPKEFDKNQRKVVLQGEAFFEIQKDTLRPFIIEAANTRTEVLGTSFGLKAYEEDPDVELVVASGSVRFSNENNNVLLQKDDKGIFSKESKQVRSAKNNDSDFLTWKSNKEGLKNTELYKQEQSQKYTYLHNESKWRKNKIQQTIIEGSIYNRAIFTEYKNIKMKATYMDASGSTIGESYFTVHKIIHPGSSINYKHRLLDWFVKTKEVRIEIIGGQN